jgi:hypothetical protein
MKCVDRRKEVLQSIVQNINFDYEQCLEWIIHFDAKFGYITMAQYIRIVESKPFCRLAKDDLLRRAMIKMDFGCYENFFIASNTIPELYQKIFMLIMIEYLFDYMSQAASQSSHTGNAQRQEQGQEHGKSRESTKSIRFSTFIVWEVIARYFIEEHQRLSPYDPQVFDSNEHSSLRKIYDFFLTKNIDLQDKMNYYIQKESFFESIVNYFYHSRNV